MSKFTLTIGTKESLAPVSQDELMASVFSVIQTLSVLHNSSLGKCECDISTTLSDWSAHPEEISLVENSALWPYLLPMWLYTEHGQFPSFSVHIDDILGDLIKWISAVESISEYGGQNPHIAILKVVTKFLARIKLEFNFNLDEGFKLSGNTVALDIIGIDQGCVPVSAGWLPEVDEEHLSLVEIALLAGISNIRTVRNAQYDNDEPLRCFKKGKQVLVTVKDARKWLSKRRSFLPLAVSAD